MDLAKIKEIVRRKPIVFLFISLGYLLLFGFIKWGIHPTMGTVLFLVGGLIGVYFLDIAEVFFNLNPSPFRSIVFTAAFVVVSLFVVTSSGSDLATGLVLSLYLSLILWQVGQWQIERSLSSWYRMVAGVVNVKTQQYILILFIAMFFIETFIYIR